MSVIFLGTSSGAGKTTLAAMYCRHLHLKGVSVAPFKASNLSHISTRTSDGGEIGMGQAFQAWCSGIEPTADMNPVLLRPHDNRIRMTVLGKVRTDLPKEREDHIRAMSSEVCGSYDRISCGYDVVVCEGSGSPSELNLLDRDLANTGMMRSRSIPAILVGDIERGGVFAAIYGTWLLIPDNLKHLMKGFIINRFRGDPSILSSGVVRIEELTGMKCLGIMPYDQLEFPEEDSLSESCGDTEGVDARSRFVGNMDILLRTAVDSGLDFDSMDRISGA